MKSDKWGTQVHSTDAHWSESIASSKLLQAQNYPKWESMISCITERDLSAQSVLDFGCNLGGFLRLLYERQPFRYGLGVHINPEFLRYAAGESIDLPIEYVSTIESDRFSALFDTAFSHEVIHLLPDLDAHAENIWRVLKSGGSYYLLKTYSTRKVWALTKKVLRRKKIRGFRREPQEVIDTFERHGFHPAVRPLPFNWFAPCGSATYKRYKNFSGMLDHYTHRKLLFRFTRPMV